MGPWHKGSFDRRESSEEQYQKRNASQRAGAECPEPGSSVGEEPNADQDGERASENKDDFKQSQAASHVGYNGKIAASYRFRAGRAVEQRVLLIWPWII